MKKPKIVEQLKKHEGFRGLPYQDTTGHLTIGYGRNLNAKPITEVEAEFMLINDITEVGIGLEREIPEVLQKCNNARMAVLIDMAYNMGVAGLLTFKKTLKLIKKEKWEEAGVEMLDSKWSNQVKKRAIRLSKQLSSGKYVY